MFIRHLLFVTIFSAAAIIPAAGTANASPRDEKAGSGRQLPSVTWRSATSADDSAPAKTVSVRCAADERPVAGGGMTAGAAGPARLTGHGSKLVSGAGGGYTVTAAETVAGTFGTWYVVAWVTCADGARK